MIMVTQSEPKILRFLLAGVSYEDQQRLRQASGDSFQGWKIHVHDPGEFPEVRKKGIFVGLGKEVSVRYSENISRSLFFI